MSILEVKGLQAFYFTTDGIVRAVDNVDFELSPEHALGIVGESGCGKSTIGLSIINLLPYPGKIVGGKILLDGENLVEKSVSEIREIRWKRISMIFQGALNALNPLMKVGNQISEAILAHEKATKDDAWKRGKELLEMTGIDSSRINDYPFELSGGMKQRVMIAMALACNPQVVIADEPTTALDVVVRTGIIELLRDLQRDMKLSTMLITHDFPGMSQLVDSVVVMYAGKIVEKGSLSSILDSPIHPYTKELINSIPSISGSKKRLKGIPGSPPDLLHPGNGCRFHPRCPYAKEHCGQEEPEMIEVKKGHYAACHFAANNHN